MITATIGKIFLEAYNEKFGTNYDAKTFFVEEYYPLFFDSNKYLQWVQNSPFVQMKKGQKVETLTSDERREKLQDFIRKVDSCKVPDASIAPGFPASEEKGFATTSGQVTNLNFSTTKEDIYYSWLGSSLGIGVRGGYILFSDKTILLDLFDGWVLYRKALNEIDKLKGNQINSWNGQWLAHCYDKKNYHPTEPMAEFNPYDTQNEGMSIKTISWTNLLIKIAKHFNNAKLISYIYGFDAKKKLPVTFGFILTNLEGIRRPLDLYRKFFGMNDNEGNKAEDLWGSEDGLRVSCQKGIIGVEAMKPKGLKQFMEGKTPKPALNEEQQINYNVYQIWLLAMLNNQELWDKSQEFAKKLHHYACSGTNGRTGNSRKVDEIKSSINKKQFIEAVAAIMPDIDNVDDVVKLVELVNVMPTDNVPYFLTLLRFHYAAMENNSKK